MPALGSRNASTSIDVSEGHPATMTSIASWVKSQHRERLIDVSEGHPLTMASIDASVLVDEAYRGSPNEVRSVARAVILDSFRSGPNIALELLDQFPGRARTDSLSDFIGELSGWTLPGPRTPGWRPPVELFFVLLLRGHCNRIRRFRPMLQEAGQAHNHYWRVPGGS